MAVEKYSALMPRTKPEITRPPETTSSMAISSAMRRGFSRRGSPLPRIASLAREHRRHHVGARHRPVAVLVVLVDAQAVPAELLRVLELVEVLVVELLADLRVVVAVRERHPRRGLVVVHDVRHQVKVIELHLAPVSGRQKSITASATAAGSSRWGTCPESANTWRRAPGISFLHVSLQGTRGASRSWAPQQTSVGAVIRASRRRRSGS